MKKIKRFTLFLLAVTIIAVSCKKEKTQWDTDWSAPLAYGSLTINDMIPVDFTTTNSDNYLSLIIDQPVFSFSLDTLIELPDTSVGLRTALEFETYDVTPSFILPNSYDQAYDVGDIELKRVIIESGSAYSVARSEWDGKTIVYFNFENVIGPDGALSHTFNVPAGTVASPSQDEVTINMANYDMDLTGLAGDQINAVAVNVIVYSGEDTETFTVTNTDSVSLSFEFRDLIPRYAKGYFGQYDFSDTVALAFPQLDRIVSGSIALDSIDLNVSIRNGFNLVAQSKITTFSGKNTKTGNTVELDFAEKGSVLNINPASGGLYDYVPSEYPIALNNDNSNMLPFIENLPDSLSVGFELLVNPFGNITGGNDEFFPDSKMELYVDGELPLSFAMEDLTIQDTLAISSFEFGSIAPTEGDFVMSYTNGFPVSAETKFFLLDENNVIIDSISANAALNSGIYNVADFSTTPVTGETIFALTEAQIENISLASKLILNVAFNSYESGNVKIAPESQFDFSLRSNLNIRIEN